MLRLRASFQRQNSPCLGIYRHLFAAKRRQPNNRSRENDDECQAKNEDRKEGWKKKKVCLVFGYTGTGFSGLQMIDPLVNTLERELENALFGLGCILPTNRQSLDKIGWSRSSRTDKGVHAARIAVSCKLLISPDWLYPERGLQDSHNEEEEELEAQRFPGLVEQLNLLLPPAVRAFSCTRVNKGFQARETCHWREYEYLIPTKLVLAGGAAGETADPPHRQQGGEAHSPQDVFVARLNEVFSLMEGSKSMHNYHRKKVSKNELQRKEEQRLEKRQGSGSAGSGGGKGKGKGEGEGGGREDWYVPVIGRDIMWETEEVGVEAPHRDDDDDDLDSDEDLGSEKPFQLKYEQWQPRIANESTNGSLYLVRAFSGTQGAGGAGRDMVCIRLRGQGFLMSQIRLMVSAAVLYARGVIPLTLVHLSLDTPYRCTFPLAPAEGLLLVDSGYSRNVSGHCYSLHPHHEEEGEGEGEGAAGDDETSTATSFMTAEEYDLSEDFKAGCIYPEVVRGWEGEGLMSRWLLHCDEFHISPRMHDKLKNLLEDYRAFSVPREKVKFDIYTRRVAAYREKYRHHAQELKKRRLPDGRFGSSRSSSSNVDRREIDRRGGGTAPAVEFQHKLFLPNGTSAALIVKFNVLPSGHVITQALRALALAVAEGGEAVPPLFADAAHVVQFVCSTEGGIATWAERRPTSPLIV